MFINFIWGIIGTVILLNVVIGLLTALGLAWMPFGAFIYAREGKRKGQSPVRYAFTGAVSSLLFYIPWLYIKKWIEGKPVPRKNIICAYAFLYVAWISGPFALWSVVFFSSVAPFVDRLLAGAFLLVIVLTLLILVSARKQGNMHNGYLPRWPYLLPLLGAYVSSVPSGILFLWEHLEIGGRLSFLFF